jgi:hypothetical protein
MKKVILLAAFVATTLLSASVSAQDLGPMIQIKTEWNWDEIFKTDSATIAWVKTANLMSRVTIQQMDEIRKNVMKTVPQDHNQWSMWGSTIIEQKWLDRWTEKQRRGIYVYMMYLEQARITESTSIYETLKSQKR